MTFSEPTGAEAKMKSSGGARMSRTPIKRQRPSYSCTECSRRKLRCSKRIPCLACIERGIESQCRLRQSMTERTRTDSGFSNVADNMIQQKVAGSSVAARSGNIDYRPRNELDEVDTPSLPSALSAKSEGMTETATPQDEHKILETVSQDAAVTLEFLALSRQNILSVVQLDHQQQNEDGNTSQPIDLIFTKTQVDEMMIYHEDNIAWVHNVVHMPTFRQQCKEMFESPLSRHQMRLALYYAMLAVHTAILLLDTN